MRSLWAWEERTKEISGAIPTCLEWPTAGQVGLLRPASASILAMQLSLNLTLLYVRGVVCMYARMDILEAHAESGMQPCGCTGKLAALLSGLPN